MSEFFEPITTPLGITLTVLLVLFLITAVTFLIMYMVYSKKASSYKTELDAANTTLEANKITITECANTKTSLATCQSDMQKQSEICKKCDTDKATCTKSLDTCTKNLQTSTAGSTTCTKDLATCKTASTKCSSSLATCTGKAVPVPIVATDLSSSSLNNAAKPLSYLIDRNVNTNSLTNNTGAQWILFTLKKVVPITKIVIEASRVVAEAGRMTSVVVEILDASKKVLFTSTISKENATTTVTPPTAVSGKYVRITHPGKQYLTLSEVTIYTTIDGANTYSSY